MTLRPFNSFRLSAYAAEIVRNIPIAVNATVITTCTYIERRIELSAKIFLYASSVKPLGIRKTLLAITNASSLMDLENRWMNGIRQLNATSPRIM